MKSRTVFKRTLGLLLALSMIAGMTLPAAAVTVTVINDPDETFSEQAGYTVIGQSFTPTVNAVIDFAEIHISSPAETQRMVRADLYAADGNMPTGSSLGTSDTVTVDADVKIGDWTALSFGTPVPVCAGMKYVLVFSSSDVLNFTYSLNTYDGGMLSVGSALYTNNDLLFRITMTPAVYSAVFDTDGGSKVETQTVNYGETVQKPDDPEKEGHTFAGWFTNGNFSAAYDFLQPVTDDLTIFAKWTVNAYTVKFNTGGGSAVAPITAAFGTVLTAPNDPAKEGHTFTGWNPALPKTMPAKDLTLTAQWKVNNYTITFDTGGGSLIAPVTLPFGTAVTAPAQPSRSGYAFAGWSPEIPATMPACNLTLTALWTAAAQQPVYVRVQPDPVEAPGTPAAGEEGTPPLMPVVSDDPETVPPPADEDPANSTPEPDAQQAETALPDDTPPLGGADTGDTAPELFALLASLAGLAGTGTMAILRKKRTQK